MVASENKEPLLWMGRARGRVYIPCEGGARSALHIPAHPPKLTLPPPPSQGFIKRRWRWIWLLLFSPPPCAPSLSQGLVKRRWIWLLLFSPLWGSLFINFGLGPIVSRTDDITPLLANTAAFLVAATLPYLGYVLLGEKPAPPTR